MKGFLHAILISLLAARLATVGTVHAWPERLSQRLAKIETELKTLPAMSNIDARGTHGCHTNFSLDLTDEQSPLGPPDLPQPGQILGWQEIWDSGEKAIPDSGYNTRPFRFPPTAGRYVRISISTGGHSSTELLIHEKQWVASLSRRFESICERSQLVAESGNLNTLQQRAKSLGGSLDVDSEPGKGTRITLVFPIQSRK